MVTNQKSILSMLIANPPNRTTVAQINPRVPRPVAAFSRIASLRAKRVSFFSGALDSCFGLENGVLLVLLLCVVSILVCGKIQDLGATEEFEDNMDHNRRIIGVTRVLPHIKVSSIKLTFDGVNLMAVA
ncbi:hypothetical protein L1987_54640 [Smallanthus sonchifolius]|uniref:Uncharacterized protein n=1 Tax=Smallanthus sonchifolius TaxID=185202 RepID=A0ACB9E8D7_9ASTR|nr:hypothetical protein L1987_54640 [Smallanthus sonchifolius]